MVSSRCAERVKKALEAVPEVLNVYVSLEAGTAVIQAKYGTDIEIFKKAVEKAGYRAV